MNINTFFDFCSGIGGGRLGLALSGLTCVGYSDTARLAPLTYNLMFDTSNEQNFGNLKRIKANSLPNYDLLIAGFPCQSSLSFVAWLCTKGDHHPLPSL